MKLNFKFSGIFFNTNQNVAAFIQDAATNEGFYSDFKKQLLNKTYTVSRNNGFLLFNLNSVHVRLTTHPFDYNDERFFFSFKT